MSFHAPSLFFAVVGMTSANPPDQEIGPLPASIWSCGIGGGWTTKSMSGRQSAMKRMKRSPSVFMATMF